MAPMSREGTEQVLAEYQEHLESLKGNCQTECPKLDKELKKAIDRECRFGVGGRLCPRCW